MTNQNIWKGRIIEAIVIVGSILLAFSIDAAWEARKETIAAADYIRALKIDAESSLEQLDRIISSSEGILQGNILIHEYLDNPESIDPDSLNSAFGNFTAINFYRADTKTYDQLVSSGDLRLLNQDVRNALSDWTSKLSLAKEYQEQVAIDFRTATVTQYGVSGTWLSTNMYNLRLSSLDGIEPRFPIEISSLSESREFENLLLLQMLLQTDTLTAYRRLRESLTSLIEVLNQEANANA